MALPRTPKISGEVLATPTEFETAEKSFASEKQRIGEQQDALMAVREERRKAESGLAEAESAQKIAVKEAGQRETENYLKDIQGRQKEYETKFSANEMPTHRPTQEDLSTYAQLGSLLMTMGLMTGLGAKGNAKAGLDAMTGMLNGWRKGRQDLWKQESVNFEKAFNRVKAERDAIYKNFQEGMKLASTNYAAAKEKFETAAFIAGAGTVTQKRIYAGDLKAVEENLQNIDKVWNAFNDKVRGAAGTLAQVRIQKDLAQIQANATLAAAQAKAAAPGRVGQNALTFASRVYGNILNASADLKNLTLLPKTAESPLLSGMINTEPSTALGSIRAFVGREVTNADARAFDQVTNSLDAALARLEAQGVASGATQGAIRSFNALKPKAGDPALNMAMYIARVKQEIETGIRVHREMPGATQNQKEEAAQELQKINRIIPFSVDDVLSVARGGRGTLNEKMINLVQKPSVAQGIQYQGLSPLDVDATQQTDKSYPAASSRKAMPSGTKLTEYARTYFNGDEGQAKQYLTTQGYE